MSARLLTCCLITLFCGLAQTASAASLRCGNYLIQDGARNGTTKYEVLKKCGEPVSRMGNTWVYKSAARTKLLQFNNSGTLVTIRDE
ncbi:MAG: DUF2845 domain-containing protein [Gammaproteobacteria bacterium]|nr:DUF2845 domain-containing protein [Gammaproteobacteria bacterium]